MSMTEVINSLQFCQFQASVCQLGWHLLVKRSERRRDQEELRDSERAEPDLTGGRDEEGRETMMQDWTVDHRTRGDGVRQFN